MAHEIETCMFVGETPWHGLGTKLTDPPTVRDALVASGLDWTVATKTLVLAEDGTTRVPAFATVRSSDGRVLGVVGPDYKVLQNDDAFSWFQPFLDSGDASLHTAGSLRNGQRVWILAEVANGVREVVPGDAVKAYLLLSNSHDGTMAVRVGFTPIRVVCQNTLSAAISAGSSKLIRVRHTGDVVTTLEEIRATMDAINGDFVASMEQYKLLASRQISSTDLERYVKRVLVTAATAPDTSGERMVEWVRPLFESGRGNDMPGVKGTWWAAYNAVSEYLSHERGHSQDTRLDSLWFGQSATLNKKALSSATSMALGGES